MVPTRRLQRHILEQIARQKREHDPQQAWPAPAVAVWEDWLAQVWRRLRNAHPAVEVPLPMLLQPAQEAALWDREIRSAAQDELLNVHATSRSAANSWQLLHDHCLLMEDWRQSDPDVATWYRWAEGLRRACCEHNWITYAELPRRLVQALEDGAWSPPQRIRFSGFANPTPAQMELWNALERVGCEIDQHADSPLQSDIKQVPCRDPLDELVRAARWARALLQKGVNGPIGVVVRDLANLRDETVATFRDILDPPSVAEGSSAHPALFHISLGRPLSDHPVVADALCLLHWYQQALPIAAITRVLRSPFINGDATERVARANVDNELRALGWHEVSVVALRNWLQRNQQCPELLQCLQRASKLAQKTKRRSPGDWVSVFSDWLNCFAWPGPRELDSAEYQTLVTWRELLSRFAATSLVATKLSPGRAIAQLSRMARQQIYQPLADPAPVQVMGLEEARGLRFSQLWIAGMSEDEWPPAPRPDPFLPMSVQRKAGLPNATAESALQLANDLTNTLRGAAETIVVSFPRQKSEQLLKISPLFADTKAMEPVFSEFAGAVALLSKDKPELELLQDHRGPPVADNETLHGGAGLFQDQALCPFRAFAHRRLHATSTPRMDPGISPAAHGELVHAALARLWHIWQDKSKLHGLSAMQREAAIIGVVDVLVEETIVSRSAFSDALWRVQRERLVDLLMEWVELESARPDFRVVATEKKLTAEFGGISVRLQLDRVDETGGGVLVLDFKTGSPISVKRWFDERPEQPQLPLYALAAEQTVQGIAFAWVRRGACTLAGVSGTSMAIPGINPIGDDPGSWEAQLRSWRAAVDALGKEIRSGMAKVSPKNIYACQNCDLHGLCRIYELRRSAQTDHGV